MKLNNAGGELISENSKKLQKNCRNGGKMAEIAVVGISAFLLEGTSKKNLVILQYGCKFSEGIHIFSDKKSKKIFVILGTR